MWRCIQQNTDNYFSIKWSMHAQQTSFSKGQQRNFWHRGKKAIFHRWRNRRRGLSCVCVLVTHYREVLHLLINMAQLQLLLSMYEKYCIEQSHGAVSLQQSFLPQVCFYSRNLFNTLAVRATPISHSSQNMLSILLRSESNLWSYGSRKSQQLEFCECMSLSTAMSGLVSRNDLVHWNIKWAVGLLYIDIMMQKRSKLR